MKEVLVECDDCEKEVDLRVNSIYKTEEGNLCALCYKKYLSAGKQEKKE